MRYEIRKALLDRKILVAILFFLVVNTVCIVKICRSNAYDYSNISMSEYDMELYKEDIKYNISNLQDTALMQKIYSNVSDRAGSYITLETREKEYIEYNTYRFFLIALVVMLTVKIIECERSNNMKSLLYTSENCGRQMLRKQFCIVIYSVGSVLLFEIVNMIEFAIFGSIDVLRKMYTVPGYELTWFNGSVFGFKLIQSLLISFCMLFVGQIVVLIARYLQGEIKNLFVSIVALALLIFASDKLVLHMRAFSPFTVFDLRNIISDYEVFPVNGTGILIFWMLFIITVIYCVFLFTINTIKLVRGKDL